MRVTAENRTLLRRIQATLNSLLGVVRTLTAGLDLDEVEADNKNLRSLVEKKKAADGTSPRSLMAMMLLRSQSLFLP